MSFDELRGILRSWERLRLFYNAWLVAVVALFGIGLLISNELSIRFAVIAVEGAIAANLCFFAGPFAEAYLFIVGWKHPAIRTILFTGGTILATFLAIAVIGSATLDWLPDQD